MTHASIYAQAAFVQWISHEDRAFQAFETFRWSGRGALKQRFIKWIADGSDLFVDGDIGVALSIWYALQLPRWAKMFPDDSHRRVFFDWLAHACVVRPKKGLPLLYKIMRRMRIGDLHSLSATKEVHPDGNDPLTVNEPATFVRTYCRELRAKIRMELSLFNPPNLSEELRHLIGTFVSECINHDAFLPSVEETKQHAQRLVQEAKSAHTSALAVRSP